MPRSGREDKRTATTPQPQVLEKKAFLGGMDREWIGEYMGIYRNI